MSLITANRRTYSSVWFSLMSRCFFSTDAGSEKHAGAPGCTGFPVTRHTMLGTSLVKKSDPPVVFHALPSHWTETEHSGDNVQLAQSDWARAAPCSHYVFAWNNAAFITSLQLVNSVHVNIQVIISNRKLYFFLIYPSISLKNMLVSHYTHTFNNIM